MQSEVGMPDTLIMVKIAVVVPNLNGKDFIGACLDSLRAQSLKPHIIVVDNGSTDGSEEFLRKNYPEVEVLTLKQNRGFAGGVNVGLKRALENNFQYVALLNNDAVVDNNWLKFLTDIMNSSPKAGIVASKILAKDQETIDSTGEEYSIWGTPFPRGRGEIDRGQYDSKEMQSIFAASGGASLYRAAMLHKIGLFDERFFAYYEDVDISFRARLAGWEVCYQPKARVYHAMNTTSKRFSASFADYHKLKNYAYLYIKNMPGKLFWKYLLSFIAGFLGRSLILLSRRRFNAVLKAWVMIVLHLPVLFISRLKTQKLRTVSIKLIDALLYKKPSPDQARHWPFLWISKK